jgi:delta 1-pyrroline-5-carboxylate dehydrogenase
VTEVINPATEQVVGSVAQTSVAETDAAIERAYRAGSGWRAVAPGDRARLLRRFAEAVDSEVANSGHAIGNVRWEAGDSAAPERLFGRQIPVLGGVNLTFAEVLVREGDR